LADVFGSWFIGIVVLLYIGDNNNIILTFKLDNLFSSILFSLLRLLEID
jgi:hypothetical protein